ncbi:hypothetical protein HK096_004510 [Nowakowskiella sp. JEL0078]|nr:hypothetical protein HK096_004510 [Nowakowskiella sp. JEL0078]
MSINILITGASGYLGGSLLEKIHQEGIPPHGKLYALVRKEADAAEVKKRGALPISFDAKDSGAVRKNIVENNISVVFFLIDAVSSDSQVLFIEALAEVKRNTGKEVHFLHTSGAKLFSSHAGAPTNNTFFDTNSGIYDIQKSQVSPFKYANQAITTNCTVIEEAEKYGVKSYIFIPCIVYGRGLGFGNKISIQTADIIKAALSSNHVYKIDTENSVWPVSHVTDTTALYKQILSSILVGNFPESGRNGYYLASSGLVGWNDIYAAIASALYKRGVIADSEVKPADAESLSKMAEGLGCQPQVVALKIAGWCTLRAKRGEKLGWKSKFDSSHILEAADDEVELILEQL